MPVVAAAHPLACAQKQTELSTHYSRPTQAQGFNVNTDLRCCDRVNDRGDRWLTQVTLEVRNKTPTSCSMHAVLAYNKVEKDR